MEVIGVGCGIVSAWRGGRVLYTSRFFFFFQAEDGIRDLTVTGVQTCALPISGGGRRSEGRPRPPRARSADRIVRRSRIAAPGARAAALPPRAGRECRGAR